MLRMPRRGPGRPSALCTTEIEEAGTTHIRSDAIRTPFSAWLELRETGLRGNLEAIVSQGVSFGHSMPLVVGIAGTCLPRARDEHARGLRISVGTVAGRVPVMTSAGHWTTCLRVN